MSSIDRGPARQRLERGYRRLLALYPAPYRLAYADEILGVLMDGAREDQRRPRFGESVNLVVSAVRLRLVRDAQPTGHGWFDALAVLAVLTPILMLTHAARTAAASLGALIASPPLLMSIPAMTWSGMAAWGAACLIVLCGLRWRAAAVTWGVTLLGLLLTNPQLLASGSVVEAAMVTAVALSLPGGGPRCGLALLGWRRVRWFLAAGAVIALAPVIPGSLATLTGSGVAASPAAWSNVAVPAVLTYVIGPALAIKGGAGLTPTVRRRFLVLVSSVWTFLAIAILASEHSSALVLSPNLSLRSWPRLVLPLIVLGAGTLLVRYRERSLRPR